MEIRCGLVRAELRGLRGGPVLADDARDGSSRPLKVIGDCMGKTNGGFGSGETGSKDRLLKSVEPIPWSDRGSMVANGRSRGVDTSAMI